jgi:hypothetical protein
VEAAAKLAWGPERGEPPKKEAEPTDCACDKGREAVITENFHGELIQKCCKKQQPSWNPGGLAQQKTYWWARRDSNP